jgi:hypothetical protein
MGGMRWLRRHDGAVSASTVSGLSLWSRAIVPLTLAVMLAALSPEVGGAQSTVTGQGSMGPGQVAPNGARIDDLPVLTPEQLRIREENLNRTHLPGPPLPVEPGGTRRSPAVPATGGSPGVPVPAFGDTPQGAAAAPRRPEAQDSPQAAGSFTYFRVKEQHPFYAGGNSEVLEPSVGTAGSVVFMSNNWAASYSTDGGNNFTFVNPYSLFPSLDGGFCCDQTVIYDRTRDLFAWQLLYLYSAATQKGSYRIAFAHSSAIASSSWCSYDFNPQHFGLAAGLWLDYPEVALSNNFIYYTANVFNANDQWQTTVIWRIPLSAVSTCSGFTFNYLVQAQFGFTLVQGASTTMYWLSHNSTSQVRLYRWAENSGTIFWDDVNVSTFYASTPSCPAPDGLNWCGRSDVDHGRTGWVANGVIGFMWNSSQGGSFPYPYIHVARFNEANRALINEPIIWNPNYAWIYPGIGVNDRGHIAGTAFWGGGGNYPTMVNLIWDDFSSAPPPWENYGVVTSGFGSNSRWGDYYHSRRHGVSGNTWVATGQAKLAPGNSGVQIYYVWFGRERDSPGQKAVLTTPPPGSTLPGPSVMFGWTSGTEVSQYWLYVGSTMGGADLYNASTGTAQSATVHNLPMDGRIIYVRLWSLIFGAWQYNDYTYADGQIAVMTSPPPGSVLSSDSVTFGWTSGTGVSQYWLYVGTTPAGFDLYDRSTGTNQSATANNLPRDGRTLYVRLWSLVGNIWLFNDYTYAAGPKAVMTSPVPQSILSGSSATFGWTAGNAVGQYWLHVGTTVGGANLYNASTGTTQSATVNGLPTDGRTIYVRLWSLLANNSWQFNDYTYTATGAAQRPQMATPPPGTTLSGSSVTFGWTSGTGISQYWLYIGSSPGGTDLYDHTTGANLSVTVNGLPRDGRTLYVRLWSLLANNSWQFNDYTYRASPGN